MEPNNNHKKRDSIYSNLDVIKAAKEHYHNPKPGNTYIHVTTTTVNEVVAAIDAKIEYSVQRERSAKRAR